MNSYISLCKEAAMSENMKDVMIDTEKKNDNNTIIEEKMDTPTVLVTNENNDTKQELFNHTDKEADEHIKEEAVMEKEYVEEPVKDLTRDEKFVKESNKNKESIVVGETIKEAVDEPTKKEESVKDHIEEPSKKLAEEPAKEIIEESVTNQTKIHTLTNGKAANSDFTQELSGPVLDFYKHKNILMTGATGFIGKTILWKLIQSLQHNLGRVYILIRSGSNKRNKIGRPVERLKNEIFNNKVRFKIKNIKLTFFISLGLCTTKTTYGEIKI